jgi:hypothetical protein
MKFVTGVKKREEERGGRKKKEPECRASRKGNEQNLLC